MHFKAFIFTFTFFAGNNFFFYIFLISFARLFMHVADIQNVALSKLEIFLQFFFSDLVAVI